MWSSVSPRVGRNRVPSWVWRQSCASGSGPGTPGRKFELVGDLIDVGNRVAVRLIWTGKSRGTQTQLEFTAVYTVRRGKVSYQESFWDHAEALEAVGLSE